MWLFRKTHPFPAGYRKFLIARGILGFIPMSFYYFAFQYMPLGDISMIGSTSVMFSCIHARIFLKEPIKKMDIVNVIIVILGLTLIVQPPILFGHQAESIYHTSDMALYAACALSFGSAVCEPLKNVLLRKMKGEKVFVRKYLFLQIRFQLK